MSTLSHVTVVGTGAMGTLCASLLAETDIEIALWGRSEQRVATLIETRVNSQHLPEVRLAANVRPTCRIGRDLARTDLIVSAVPCQFIRKTWTDLLASSESPPAESIKAPVLSVSKGIEVGTLRRPSQILAELIPGAVQVVLSGPCLAAEIASGLPTAAVVASADESLAREIQDTMSSPRFRLYTTGDVVGVELAGATKNVISLAAGIVDGLGLGDNAKAGLLTRGLVEITRLGLALGASSDTFRGLAGIGDLIATAHSRLSRNHIAGSKIGRGLSLAQVVETSKGVIEGIETTRSVLALAEEHDVEMPITRAVHSVLFESVPPADAIDRLMRRQLGTELPA